MENAEQERETAIGPHNSFSAFPLIVMGEVLAPYGIKGWLKIRPYSEKANALLAHRRWHIASHESSNEWREAGLAEGREHGAVLVARLEGMSDRDQALALAGAKIAVRRDELPPPPEGEFYWSDLIGSTVTNVEGVKLGTVGGLLQTAAHAVLEVAGERERLIPFVDAYVREVDPASKAIRVDWQPDY